MTCQLRGLALVALLSVFGCGADASGGWSGTWTGANASGAGNMTLSLRQLGSQVSGEAIVLGAGCFAGGTVSATVSGDTISATASSGQVEMRMDGTLSSDDRTMGGTYVFAGGVCTGQNGEWSVSRQ